MEFKKWLWKYDKIDDPFEYLEDDYIRPFFFLMWSMHYVGYIKMDSLLGVLLRVVSIVFIFQYLFVDIILLPFKLLWSVKI